MEDDSFPQQEPAFFLQGLRHHPPEERGGETGVPAAAGKEDVVPGPRSRTGRIQAATLPVQGGRADPEQ